MATKVNIKNFQSIEEADLEIKGFTVITGKNNSGKSAVQRAIRGVFQNTRGHSFVRHGATHTEVSLTFDDGKEVTWSKGKKENKYLINGKEFDKVGAGTPEELDDFMVQPITAGGREIWSQFAPQFTGQVFLLSETGSVLAEAISDVERVQTLNNAMKESERDKRSANSTLKVRKKDEKALEKELEHYVGLDAIGLLLDTIESLERKIEVLDHTLAELSGYRSRLDGLLGEIRELCGVTTVSLPDFTEVVRLDDDVDVLVDLNVRYQEACTTVKELNGLSEVNVPDESSLVEVSEALDSLCELQRGHARAIKGIDLMTGMCASLENDLIPLERVDFLAKTESTLRELQSLQMEWDICKEQLEDLEKDIQQNKRDQVALQRHLKEHIHEEGACPLCGSSVC
jgi:chromosome segregation ATPase